MIIAGNWKMYKTPAESLAFCESLLKSLVETQGLEPRLAQLEWILFPPAVNWTSVQAGLKEAAHRKVFNIRWGAQNCHTANEGAFTGENSPSVLKSLGGEYVLVGHSERRQLFQETDEALAKKVRAVQELGLIPMLCLGETLEQREAGQTESVILRQLEKGLSERKPGAALSVAYEPVWAIGTGKVATPAQAEEAHQILRQRLRQLLGVESDSCPLLYGGSVKPENAAELAQQPHIDGFLIGGASLKVDSFVGIGKAACVS